MKNFAKLLVLPVAFLAMAGVKATDYTIDNDTVNVTLDATKAVGDSIKATVGTFDTGTFEASESTTEYATCKVTAVTTAYVAPVAEVKCTAEDIAAAQAGDPCKGGEAGVTNKVNAVAKVSGVYACKLDTLVIPEGAGTVTFSTVGQALTSITLGNQKNLTIASSITSPKEVAVSGKVTMGTYSTLLIDGGTLRGDVKTAGAFRNNAGSYSGTVSYDTVGKPGKVTKVGDVADNKVKLTWDAVPGAKSYTVYRANAVDGTYTSIKADVADITYTDNTLASGKSYWYKVAAKGENGKLSDKGDAMDAAIVNGIPEPETLTVKAASYNSVTITAGKVSGATGYNFYRCDANNCATAFDWKLVKSTTSNTYTDKDLTPGKTYAYTVAVYVTNNSVKSFGKTFGEGFVASEAATVNATLAADTQFKTATPKLDKAKISKVVESSTAGKAKITLEKVSGASGYVVFNNGKETCRTTSTTCTTKALVIGDVNSFTAVAYKLNEAPAADLLASAAVGAGYSEISVAKTYTAKPGEPKIVSSNVKLLEVGTPGYYNTVEITVNNYEVSNGETVEYVLYKATKKKGSYSKLDVAPVVVEGVARKFVVTDLKPGKTYYFKAKVKVNGTLSDASNIVSKETKMTPYTKNADLIKKLTAVAEGNKKIVLTLTDNTEGATGYAIYRSTKSNGTYKLIKTILVDDVDNPAEITYKNTKLTVGQKYYYKVRAYKTVDGKKVFGKYSSKVSATATLEAPTELEVADTTKKTVSLSWEKVKGANGYRVYNSDDEVVATVTKASATIKGLDASTTYTFYVRAYANVSGKKKLGAKSENIDATTTSAD